MNPLRHSLLASLLALTPLVVAPLTRAQAPMAPVTDHGKSIDGKPLASPAAVAQVSLAGKTITIDYNTPSMRGRKIMGELVPYGQVWRTGANPATSFVTTADLLIGTLKVPAGSYTLYTLPAAPGTPWLLILNKQTGQWGTVYEPAQDLGRTPLTAATLPAPQELMSLTFEKTTPTSTQLHIKWETTDQWVKIQAAP